MNADLDEAADLLRAPEAARRLDVPTKDLLRLIYDREIRHVTVGEIAHVPASAVDDHRAQPS